MTRWHVLRVEYDSWRHLTIESFLIEFAFKADALAYARAHLGEDITVREVRG